MNDVATEAGVSRGSVYRSVPDRDALIQAVLERVAELRVAEAEPAVRRDRSLAGKVAEAAVVVRRLGDEDRRLGLHEHRGEPALATLRLATSPTCSPGGSIAGCRSSKRRAGMAKSAPISTSVRLRNGSCGSVISLVTVPSLTVDLGDAQQLRRFIEDHLLRGFRD